MAQGSQQTLLTSASKMKIFIVSAFAVDAVNERRPIVAIPDRHAPMAVMFTGVRAGRDLSVAGDIPG